MDGLAPRQGRLLFLVSVTVLMGEPLRVDADFGTVDFLKNLAIMGSLLLIFLSERRKAGGSRTGGRSCCPPARRTEEEVSASENAGWASPVRSGCRSAVLAGMLLAVVSAEEAVAQPRGLFRAVAPTGVAAGLSLETAADSITLRRRLVAVDLGQLTRSAPARPGATAAPVGVLTLNLFDDASFTGLVQSVAPTFSGGYSLSGPLSEIEMGTMTLVVNGEVVVGTCHSMQRESCWRPR